MSGTAFVPFANAVLPSLAQGLIAQQLTTVVTIWPKSELAEHCDDMLLLLTSAIQDHKAFVRVAAGEALCAFGET
ncbi:hypothetical protein H257_01376 [Aphanomyces astaci]|uniref:CLASP N-terminal domain-containing protein n=1 Tax=Aphanomyces astaci TaxID=112090 RepID=W4H7G7_APHAT|nr:hypothetical protein H257_01376 [Aphanomyces astaci]ETV87980.1 hypothetical protein H257_01376 [Aphanomyces astaci]|eukprot:XP_009822843.1 hypothetical protein H257_01376 [Aphanomyces astaci]